MGGGCGKESGEVLEGDEGVEYMGRYGGGVYTTWGTWGEEIYISRKGWRRSIWEWR